MATKTQIKPSASHSTFYVDDAPLNTPLVVVKSHLTPQQIEKYCKPGDIVVVVRNMSCCRYILVRNTEGVIHKPAYELELRRPLASEQAEFYFD